MTSSLSAPWAGLNPPSRTCVNGLHSIERGLTCDGELDLFIGQDLGGLFYLEHDSNSSAGLISLEKQVLFSVWPNPFKKEFTIELIDLFEEVTAELFTLTGERIYSCILNQKINNLQLDQLDAGVYFLRLW